MKNRRAIHRADCKRSEWPWWRLGRARSSLPDCRSNVSPKGATWTGCTFCNGLSLMDAAVNPGTGADHSSGPGGLRRRCTNCRINSGIPTRSRYGTRAPMTLPPKTSQEGGKDGTEAVYSGTGHHEKLREAEVGLALGVDFKGSRVELRGVVPLVRADHHSLMLS